MGAAPFLIEASCACEEKVEVVKKVHVEVSRSEAPQKENRLKLVTGARGHARPFRCICSRSSRVFFP